MDFQQSKRMKNQESPLKKLNRKLKQLNMESNNQIQQLINEIEAIQPKPQYFQIVKKLLYRYGLPIVIYLKPMYSKLDEFGIQANYQHLIQLASITHYVTEMVEIPEIRFVYRPVDKKDFQQKKMVVQNDQTDKLFIQLISQISKYNAQMLNQNSTLTVEQYKKRIVDLQKHSKFSKLMIRSIKDFMLPEQTIKNIEHRQAQHQQSQEQDEESGNFYNFNNQNVSKFSNSTMISYNCISFSMQQTPYLCCRKYFQQGECIKEDEDIRTSFLSIKYPFSDQQRIQIQRTICAFLNCEGGKFYIGIRKDEAGRKLVYSDMYTSNQKQLVLKQFRRIAQSIQTQLITNKMYTVQFVPIKSKKGTYIPGANVIRVSISYGVRDEFYCYQQNGVPKFPFRSETEIFYKQGRQLLKLHKKIVLNPLPIPQQLHKVPCQKPQIGEQLLQKQDNVLKKTKTSNKNKIKQKESNNDVEKFEVQRNDKTINSNETEKSDLSTTKDDSKVQEQKMKQIYLYVVGVQQKHLVPVFEAKNIKNNIKLQSPKQRCLILKVFGSNTIELTKRILKRIQQKYPQRKIKWYEMSLHMQIQNLQKNIQYLKKLNIKFKVMDKNRVQFKMYGESYQAFSCLETHKIGAKFIIEQQKQQQNLTTSNGTGN